MAVGFVFLVDFDIDDVLAEEVVATAVVNEVELDCNDDVNGKLSMVKSSLLNICFISYSTVRLSESDKTLKLSGSK
jgi:hypothetical protein